MNESLGLAASVYERIDDVDAAERELAAYEPEYRPIHLQVRGIQRDMRKLKKDIDELEQERQRISFSETVDEKRIERIRARTRDLEAEHDTLEASIPETWNDARARFEDLSKGAKRARLRYRQTVDDSYETIRMLRQVLNEVDALPPLETDLVALRDFIEAESPDAGLEAIDAPQLALDKLAETHRITSKLSRAKRALRGVTPDKADAVAQVNLAIEALRAEIEWRQRAARDLRDELESYNKTIRLTIGMRMQERLTDDQAESIADCLSVHRDLTLNF